MSRRNRRRGPDRVDTVKRLTKEIESKLGGTPLSEVGKKLLNGLLLLQFVSKEEADWGEVHRNVTAFLQRLPNDFGPRFHFDAYLIECIKDGWSEGSVTFPDTLVPVYRQEWQYERLPVLGIVEEEGTAHHLYLIGISKEEQRRVETPPFLLDYSFLCHEIAHYLFASYGGPFVDRFGEALEEALRRRARRRMPLRETAEARSESMSDELRQNWSIDRGGTWAIELAIDVAVLWACGPAYIDTLYHHLADYRDHFQLTPSHPPAALRAELMIRAGRRLSWGEQVEGLESKLEAWKAERPSALNRYRALTNEDIVAACLEAALTYCQTAQLPQLTPGDLTRIQDRVEQEKELVGRDLIVGAWLISQNRGHDDYEQWERKVFEQYVTALRDETAADADDPQ